jgi:hypothetical protein
MDLSVLRESSSLVKIFVSSRNDQDIVLHLENYPNLKLSSDKNKGDISSFVTAETQNLTRRKKLLALSKSKESLKREIIEQVTKNADGMLVFPNRVSHISSLLMCLIGLGEPACNCKVCAAPERMRLFGIDLDDYHQNSKTFTLNYTRG